MVPLATSTVEQKVVMNEFNKMTKQYRKAFENVLQGHYDDAIPILKEYLSYLDSNVKRPIRDYNDSQEALKQCWSALANAFSKSNSSTPSLNSSRKASKENSWIPFFVFFVVLLSLLSYIPCFTKDLMQKKIYYILL